MKFYKFVNPQGAIVATGFVNEDGSVTASNGKVEKQEFDDLETAAMRYGAGTVELTEDEYRAAIEQRTADLAVGNSA